MQFPESHRRTGEETLQRLRDEDAVLPQDRHDVRHCRKSRENEERPANARSLVHPAALRLRDDPVREHERDARPAEVLQMRRCLELRVDDCVRVGKLVAGQMVIRHDDG